MHKSSKHGAPSQGSDKPLNPGYKGSFGRCFGFRNSEHAGDLPEILEELAHLTAARVAVGRA